YRLSQEIAATTKLDILIPHLTQQFCEHFRSEGIQSCALWLPQESGTLAVQSVAYAHPVAPPQALESPSFRAHASLAFSSSCINAIIDGARATYFIPLQHGPSKEGILSISGLPYIASLLTQLAQGGELSGQTEKFPHLIAAGQFAAYCDQVAL